MKVSGFTFIRNALKFDYPIIEAIRSILPLCDEVLVAVGNSEDETLALIDSIDSEKIKIIKTIWDDSQREGGRVLAMETDKAFRAISKDSEWAVYIQGDEVIHEDHHDEIRQAMKQFKDNPNVDGLLFNYRHFYGSYDYVGISSNWYKHEIRVVKNDPSIYSYRDAQGFRKKADEKLTVVALEAYVNHYGWVKDPRAMQLKQESFQKLWHDDEWVKQNVPKVEFYAYEEHISELSLFDGQHPAVMEDRIARLNWKFDHDISYNKKALKDRLKIFARRFLGLDFSYKNYTLYQEKRLSEDSL